MSFQIHPWQVIETGWQPEHMRLGESLTALGNGYMGLRGNFEEDYSGDTHRGTYLGGVWFPDKTRVGWWKNGYPAYFGKVINAVNLIGIHVVLDGELLDLARCQVETFTRRVNMEIGVLERLVTAHTAQGSVKIRAQRFVSTAVKELLAIRYEVTPSWDAQVTLTPYLDGCVRNLDANYEETFWEQLAGEVKTPACALLTKTKANPFHTPRFAVAAAMSAVCPQLAAGPCAAAPGLCSQAFTGRLRAGETAVLDKFSFVVTSRDHEETALLPLALAGAETALSQGYEAALAAHCQGWRERWDMADVTIQGDDGAQQGIRFNLFQLLSTYTGEDARLNIGPKGFTGEKYGGATYWDTEAYCLPVYLAVAGEQVARQLLQYRRDQLPQAYQNARRQGLAGALYPMVTFTGAECHNEWEITFEEIHRNGAIAHAIFEYTAYTGDDTYALGPGLEVLLGIARFWQGRVHYSKRAGKYMIHGVTGPNEYENNVNNNWYTNRIAAWCLTYFVETARRAGAARQAELGVDGDELTHMETIAAQMYYPEDETLGIFVQHDTFLDKELIPVSQLPKEERPINQHWSWDHILRSCYIKQADVLQGLYFLNHLYDRETKKRNFDFYEPLTVHESSLSPCVHSILAAEIGYQEKAVEMYKRTARLDLDNINNDTEDGLHITSMSGSWLAIAQGFAGMRTAQGLSFAPFLPKGWQSYAFRFRYRGSLIRLSVSGDACTLQLEKGSGARGTVYGKPFALQAEDPRAVFPLQN